MDNVLSTICRNVGIVVVGIFCRGLLGPVDLGYNLIAISVLIFFLDGP